MAETGIPADAPTVPYRALGDREIEVLFAYVDKQFLIDDFEGRHNFWKQTMPEGRKVAERIRGAGFVVGGEIDGGDVQGDYWVDCHVYPKGYKTNFDIERIADSDSVIGTVGLWERGGFDSDPVRVWYDNPKLVTDSLELRSFLMEQGIKFYDCVDFEELERKVSELKDFERMLKILKEAHSRG